MEPRGRKRGQTGGKRSRRRLLKRRKGKGTEGKGVKMEHGEIGKRWWKEVEGGRGEREGKNGRETGEKEGRESVSKGWRGGRWNGRGGRGREVEWEDEKGSEGRRIVTGRGKGG